MKNALIRAFPSRELTLPAVLSGVLTAAAFPSTSFGPVIFVALVPLFTALLRERPTAHEAFRTGYVFGATCFLLMLWWIARLIPSADVTIPGILTPALIILVSYLALYPAAVAALTVLTARDNAIAFVFGAPALWTILEMLRASGELGFPWGQAGYALAMTPQLIQLASVGGVTLLTYLIVLVNALLALVFVGRGRFAGVIGAVAGMIVIGALALQGKNALGNTAMSPAPKMRVAVVQPDVDLALKWKRSFSDSTLHLIERLTREAVGGGAAFVVFPETCAPVYLRRNKKYHLALSSMAQSYGVPIYIGFLDYRRDGPHGDINIYNSSGVFRADGGLELYDKVHLLPFGEALPLSSKLRWLKHIEFGQANFDPGPERAPLDAGPTRFTPLICFESVFPGACARGVRLGAHLLVNITNDGWFGNTPGPHQHAEMSILRAVEFRRALLRSANTGVSMVVAPTGRVVSHLGLFREGILFADVPLESSLTFYARHGERPLRLILLGMVALAALAGRRRPA